LSIQFKLAHKGLLLIAIPLAFEIAFIFYLTGLLKQADVQVERETKSSQIIVYTNNLMRYMVLAGVSGGETSITHKAEYRDRFELYSNKLSDEIPKLEALVHDDPAKEAILKQIKARSVSLLAMMASKLRDTQQVPLELSLIVGARNMLQTEHALDVISTSLRAMTANELKIRESTGVMRAKAEAKVRSALLEGLAANFIITLLLAGYFGNNLVGRLKRLQTNTERMSKRIPLLSSGGGSDEIAELDRELHRTADKLDQLEQAKRQLITSVSNELTTPLQSIKETLGHLCSGSLGKLSAKAENRFENASLSIDRLIRLVKDLLEIEQIENQTFDLKFSDVRLSELASLALTEIAPFAQRFNVSIDSQVADELLRGDRDRLVQVLINLLSNAVKYSPEDSTVLLKSSRSAEGKLHIKVTDSGRGIPPEAISKIFDRYQQVEESDSSERGGTGLGLAICKTIVQQHNGSIDVESTLGKGSTFRITLPLQKAEGQK
jgi:signal transduction histidine kinase